MLQKYGIVAEEKAVDYPEVVELLGTRRTIKTITTPRL